jgi:nucleotide-binding universal stress UspA family protein
LLPSGALTTLNSFFDIAHRQIAPAVGSLHLMFKRILVPVDFSPKSTRAVQYAAKMMAMHGGTLYLMHAVNTAIPDPYVPAYYTLDAAREQSEASGSELEALARSIRADYGVPVETAVLIGDLSGSLNDQVQQKQADLVVMGTHGAKNWLDRLSGTHTELMVNHLPVPLLVVPESGTWQPWNVIACGTDYTGSEEALSESLLAFAAADQPQIVFIHVHRGEEQDASFPKQLLQQYVNRNLNLELLEVSGESIAKVLLETAQNRKAALLVVQALHREWSERLLHKSVAKTLATTTELPLLIIH